MEQFTLNSIGTIQNEKGDFCLKIDEKYRPALQGLDEFEYINVIWWADQHDNSLDRDHLAEKSPYKGSPDLLGTFATRSPVRPNPIAVTVCAVTNLDLENGLVWIAYIDAENDTPLLDIKPYHPSSDRVENPILPPWCEGWPNSLEESATFDWENSNIFNF